ncbi:MAG: hypothetical protein EOO73_22065 [Myxococcales bacterium]|nr:MAG: hypothetical protein EOO73_22065 [Myxococcales bacterium]
MSSLRSLAALLLLSSSLSCGGKSFDADERPSGGTSAGGTAAGGTAAGGTAGVAGQGAGGSASGGTSAGGGSAGQPNACTRFDDEPAAAVLVSITNQTVSALHLGPAAPTCETVPLFSVADATGAELPHVGWCRSSCQSLHEQGGAGCLAFCPVWDTVTLQPGETLSTIWDGHYLVEGALPSRCVSGQEAGQELTCDQAKTIRPGAYTFTARAGAEIKCESPDGCSSCAPDERGGCKSSNALVGGVSHTASAIVELDARFGLLRLPEIPGSPGAAPQEPPVVRLVFTE